MATMSRVPPTFDFQDFSVPSPSAETKDVSIVIVENPFDKAGISATTSNEEHDEAAADISDVMEAIGEVRRRLSSASANEISLNDDSTANQSQSGGENNGKQQKPRKLSRGASIKSLFGVGSKAPKTTPTTVLSPCGTPRMMPTSPAKSPPPNATARKSSHHFLDVHHHASSSIFRMPKPQVKLLKKTASVKQLYNSVLQALKTVASASSSDDVLPELTKRFFENILRAEEPSPKLSVTKVKVDSNNKDMGGRHFCSEVHAVEVTAVSGDDEETLKYHLVVKSQPSNEDARKFLQPSHTFEKEVQMYGTVFHDMATFVRANSVICLDSCKDSEVIDVPRCYYTRWTPGGAEGGSKEQEDLIILENLCPKGFHFGDGQENGLDRRHAELVIRELAKFHAISFCMKRGDNDSVTTQYPCLGEDSLYRPSTEGFTKRTITPVMASLAEVLRRSRGYEAHYEWFVELARNFHALQTEAVTRRNEFAVICHGDLLLPNILFKYSDPIDSTRPTEVKFIDFQSARFSSLATDLVLFLFTSVKTDLRRTMLGELVSLYYTTFLVSVRSLNIDTEIFSMEELFVEIENHIIYGFLEGIWYLDIIHCGHVPKTAESDDDDDDEDDDEDDFIDNDQDLSDVESEDEIDDELLDDDDAENEDEHERAILRRRRLLRKRRRRRRKRNTAENRESREQRLYKEEFFELLNEALFLLGKGDPSNSNDASYSNADDFSSKKRRSLRDTSLRFTGRNNSFTLTGQAQGQSPLPVSGGSSRNSTTGLQLTAKN